jgi:phosphate transport system protein
MDTTTKSIVYKNLQDEFGVISTAVMQQFSLVEELIEKEWQDDIYRQIIKNEDAIDEMETEFMTTLRNIIVFGVPKASDLRKLTATHESVLEMEKIGDLLMNMAENLKKAQLDMPDFTDFKATLKKMFQTLKTLVNTVVFSFFKEDKSLIYPMIEKGDIIESLSHEISDNLPAVFQEIPLTGQEMQNILSLNLTVYIMEKIKNIAIGIAKSTIFVIEGTDLRHQRFEK